MADAMAAEGVLALAGTVLASSLLGSAHCAGMCGGLALAAIGPDEGARAPRQVGYHAGRLASYAMLGAVAGVVGRVVDDAGVLIGVQRVAAVLAGVMIAGFGLAAVLRAFGVRVPSAGVPRPLVAAAQRVHVWTLRLPARHRGVPIGLATPLLPCGWLYAFAAIAAASASAWVGALVMGAFWLGTVPAVVLASNGARLAFARLGRAAPVAAGLAMIAVGLHAAVVRGGAAERAMSQVRGAQAGVTPVSVGELGERAAREPGEVPPCCRTE
jgi:sulfite exporter TauE/SafE